MTQQVVQVIDKALAHISPYLRNAVQWAFSYAQHIPTRDENRIFAQDARMDCRQDRKWSTHGKIYFLTCSSSKFLQNLQKFPQLFVSELSQFDLIDVDIQFSKLLIYFCIFKDFDELPLIKWLLN
jgi:hypothetical protein